ncbi:DsbA family oxidoreductase [Chengkuizengella sediminis]|uniref:DsbA family oxidoreductase n=1 Tax=Chengkuizengella sediminis TaxID=1885917 RepID=UPI001389781B|nr:DsbA family oxidoreductase [Chengkuizengella sediminis]NDI35616.1 DsbA family oxidoreductase [Chengkuizengella sediminis]
MTIDIKVYSDYVCPFCFIAKKTFNEAIKNKDVKVEWMPFELRPSSAPPIYPEQMKELFDQAVKPLAKKLNVNIKLPEMSPHPRTPIIHEGFLYAKDHSKGIEFNELIYKVFWEEEKNIGDISVLKEIAKQVGLDVNDFEYALKTHKYQEELETYLNKASEDEIRAIPTFVIGDQKLQGVQTKETFEKLLLLDEGTKIEPQHDENCNIDGCN